MDLRDKAGKTQEVLEEGKGRRNLCNAILISKTSIYEYMPTYIHTVE